MAITVLDTRILKDGENYGHLAGLSTDSKPTAGYCTGSEFLEVDTGDVYAFDAVGGTWAKIKAGAPAEAEA